MHDLNQTFFLVLNNYAGQNYIIDFIMILVANAMPYLFMIFLLYLWFYNQKNEALYAGYTATIGLILNQIIGLLYFHNRPFMDNLGNNLLAHQIENSFPSDHTTFTMSIAFMLLAFKSTQKFGMFTLFLALWCGIARVYCGAHYPFDIAGSALVAMIATVIIFFLKNKLQPLNTIIMILWNKSVNFLVSTFRKCKIVLGVI